ncbi:hypothetical protein PRZ48_001764 [Zasmidium cellare]|uniref:Uncharacterized protein n=1 Tax=Zasmidium cellare TaxID=395010 RepID=A0ABR0F4L2_ZASCE|nr:hypothetical protein PRZ48_001764 [Zasmidium cellare]
MAAASPMASNIRLLLRLPPTLRQSILPGRCAQFNSNGHCSVEAPFRTFASTKNLLQPKNAPKSVRKPPVQSPASSSRPTPTRSSPKGPSTPSQPIPVTPRGPAEFQPISKLNTIAPNLPSVLLYTAPRHGSFFATSYFFGVGILAGATYTGGIYLKDEPDKPRLPTSIKIAGLFTVLFLALAGTTFVMAPTKLIQSISIITQSSGRVLRFEVRKPLPFLKPYILDASPSQLAMNGTVVSTSSDASIRNVRLSEAKEFTESYFAKSQEGAPRGGVLAGLSSFNKSLVYAWPAFKRDVRRMWLRDKMTYIRIQDKGHHKLDLQGCHILDEGKPLEKAIEIDSDERPGIGGWIRRIAGS